MTDDWKELRTNSLLNTDLVWPYSSSVENLLSISLSLSPSILTSSEIRPIDFEPELAAPVIAVSPAPSPRWSECWCTPGSAGWAPCSRSPLRSGRCRRRWRAPGASWGSRSRPWRRPRTGTFARGKKNKAAIDSLGSSSYKCLGFYFYLMAARRRCSTHFSPTVMREV